MFCELSHKRANWRTALRLVLQPASLLTAIHLDHPIGGKQCEELPMQGPQFQMTERRAERPPGQHRAVASKPDKEGTSIRSEDTIPGNKVSTAPLVPESRCGRWVHASTRAGCATWPVKIDEPGQDWTGSSSCGATPAAIRERSDASSKAPHRGRLGIEDWRRLSCLTRRGC
jgi:hypothetical protein